MHEHLKNQIEKPKEGLIDLSSASFDFCTDEFIYDYFNEKMRELEDKDGWLVKNKDRLEKEKDKVAQAIEQGLVADSQPETIRKFLIEKASEEKSRGLEIKNELERQVDDIRSEVAKRIGRYLPDWTSGEFKITFTINEKADFCIDDDNITVDLRRLISEKDYVEKVKEGITHEVFHFWMHEKKKQVEIDSPYTEELREDIILHTVDEGIAVLIGGQSLKAHHEKNGKIYDDYIKESFDAFRCFMKEENQQNLEKMKREEFKDMGHFYVVGNEMTRIVLEYDGLERLRRLIVDLRNNPMLLLNRYDEICRMKPGTGHELNG